MVSTGDTEISLHIRSPKTPELPKFQFSGGGGASDLRFQRGALWRIWTKIYCLRSSVQTPACASQIVPHMWRLTRTQTETECFYTHLIRIMTKLIF